MQGTLYPDVIESGGGHGGQAATIKSHHNVGGLPDDMTFELVEPLRALFKDEVRKVGEELGPARGDRVAPAVPRARASACGSSARSRPTRWPRSSTPTPSCARRSRKAGLEREIWQSFAVLPDIRSVGVMGDERTYGYPIIVRAVTSEDAMTADWARLPYEVLDAHLQPDHRRGPRRQPRGLRHHSKPPGTIEWE